MVTEKLFNEHQGLIQDGLSFIREKFDLLVAEGGGELDQSQVEIARKLLETLQGITDWRESEERHSVYCGKDKDGHAWKVDGGHELGPELVSPNRTGMYRLDAFCDETHQYLSASGQGRGYDEIYQRFLDGEEIKSVSGKLITELSEPTLSITIGEKSELLYLSTETKKE